MYNEYFGFNENPFSIAPDPRYLYMSTMHQEALAHLIYGATSKGCIILLTGEVGTGKTTISRCFLQKLPPKTDIAVIINPKLNGNELLATICDEFEIDVPPADPTTKDFIDSINRFLLESHAAGRQTVLIVDEAQNLDLDVLEMLRLLTNLETDKQKLLKIVLLGQSELTSILQRPDLLQINQRITSRYHLKGLEPDDLDGYVAHRIMVAGGGRAQFFTRGALKNIFEISRGIPRVINSLCDHALLGAYSEDKAKVNRRIVRKAAREIFGTKRGENTTSPAHRFLIIAALFSTLIFLSLWFTSTTEHADRENTGVALEQDTQAIPPYPPPLLEETDIETPTGTDKTTVETNIVIKPIEIND